MVHSIFGFQLTSRGDPLANPKSVRAWMANVPRNDPVSAVEAINSLLATAPARADGSVPRLHAILELDRIAAPLFELLRQQYRLASISDDVRQRILRGCDALAAGFSQAYAEYAKQIEATGQPARARELWHGVYARLFYYGNVLTRLGLFRYEQWIPGRWRALHQSYLAARARSLALEPYTLNPDSRPGEQSTPEQEYVQILLLHRLNTGNLTTPQIDWAAEWLREWAPPLRVIAAKEGPEQAVGGYWLDVGLGEGLRDRRPQRAEGELLCLDMEPLRAQLKALIGRLGAQGNPAATRTGPGDAEDLLGLAKRLDRLWLPQAPMRARRGERRPANHVVTVAAGWMEIMLALQSRHARSSGAPPGYHYDDYGRLRNNKEIRQRVGAPRRLERDAWQIFDSSDSGFRIRSLARQAARQWPGALLALQVEDAQGWQLGVVRRLKRVGADVTELGVEVISRNVSLVLPKEIDNRDSGYTVDGIDVEVKGKSFQALYLPPQAQTRVRTPASLIVPPAEFTLGRRLSLTIEGQSHPILLASPLERTREWVWAPLRSG